MRQDEQVQATARRARVAPALPPIVPRDRGRSPSKLRRATVDVHFSETAEYWVQVYDDSNRTLHSVIYRERRARALAWIDELMTAGALPPGARSFELGCGAGLVALDLHHRGLSVGCLDASEGMVALTRSRTVQAGLGDEIAVLRGDAHALPLPPGSRDLVVALGLIPWLHSPAATLSEAARVLVPGGYLLLSNDNLFRFVHLLDPRLAPALAPVKRLVHRIVRRIAHHGGSKELHLFYRARSFDSVTRLLTAAGFAVVRTATIGFGPVTCFGKDVFSPEVAARIHVRLQALADHGAPLIRGGGAHHLILAQRQGM